MTNSSDVLKLFSLPLSKSTHTFVTMLGSLKDGGDSAKEDGDPMEGQEQELNQEQQEGGK